MTFPQRGWLGLHRRVARCCDRRSQTIAFLFLLRQGGACAIAQYSIARDRWWPVEHCAVQDLLDAWMACQATWLYLEPIFSSADIVKQMPEEGEKFASVDASWREVMARAAAAPAALPLGRDNEALNSLRECNGLLDEIQKGLAAYLEKKRLFFPRCPAIIPETVNPCFYCMHLMIVWTVHFPFRGCVLAFIVFMKHNRVTSLGLAMITCLRPSHVPSCVCPPVSAGERRAAAQVLLPVK